MKNIFKKYLIPAILFVAMSVSICEAFSFREMTLKFAQVSDVHITDSASTSYKLLGSSKDLFSDVIDQLNETPDLDFVMFTGDMVNEPSKENYRDFFILLSGLKTPSLTAFGNHDQAAESSSGLSKEEVLALIKKCNPNYTFDKSYYAFSPKKDYRVIVLDLTQPSSVNGYISQEQLEFLDDEISQNPDKVIVIFQHHPVVEPFHSQTHEVANAKDEIAVLQKYKNPIVLLAGHYHATKITKVGNVIHVASPSLVTYPNAFRVVSITNYDDRTVFDFYFKETRLKELQEKSKLSLMTPTLFEGTEKDRLTTIVIKKK